MMAPVFTRAAWRCTWHMIQVIDLSKPPQFLQRIVSKITPLGFIALPGPGPGEKPGKWYSGRAPTKSRSSSGFLG